MSPAAEYPNSGAPGMGGVPSYERTGATATNVAVPRSSVTNLSAEQEAVTRRYERMAPLYDIYDAPMELLGTRTRRERTVNQAVGRVLEAGIGTGKNIPFYPPGTQVVGVDVSTRMLMRARSRALASDVNVTLELGDVTQLPYEDDSFDTAVATTIFCSVADPVAGLRELVRVTKPRGRILLVEHVRPRNPLLGIVADIVTPVTRRVFGFRANRRTEDILVPAGLDIVDIRREGVWREIVATPTTTTDPVERGTTP